MRADGNPAAALVALVAPALRDATPSSAVVDESDGVGASVVDPVVASAEIGIDRPAGETPGGAPVRLDANLDPNVAATLDPNVEPILDPTLEPNVESDPTVVADGAAGTHGGAALLGNAASDSSTDTTTPTPSPATETAPADAENATANPAMADNSPSVPAAAASSGADSATATDLDENPAPSPFATSLLQEAGLETAPIPDSSTTDGFADEAHRPESVLAQSSAVVDLAALQSDPTAATEATEAVRTTTSLDVAAATPPATEAASPTDARDAVPSSSSPSVAIADALASSFAAATMDTGPVSGGTDSTATGPTNTLDPSLLDRMSTVARTDNESDTDATAVASSQDDTTTVPSSRAALPTDASVAVDPGIDDGSSVIPATMPLTGNALDGAPTNILDNTFDNASGTAPDDAPGNPLIGGVAPTPLPREPASAPGPTASASASANETDPSNDADRSSPQDAIRSSSAPAAPAGPAATQSPAAALPNASLPTIVPALAQPPRPSGTTPSAEVQSTRTERAGVADQLVSVVRPLTTTDGSHSLTIDLHPADLGRVRLEITVEGATVHVAMHAERGATSTLLHEAMSDLRRTLDTSGLRTGRIDVGTEPDTGAGGRDGAARHTDLRNGPSAFSAGGPGSQARANQNGNRQSGTGPERTGEGRSGQDRRWSSSSVEAMRVSGRRYGQRGSAGLVTEDSRSSVDLLL